MASRKRKHDEGHHAKDTVHDGGSSEVPSEAGRYQQVSREEVIDIIRDTLAASAPSSSSSHTLPEAQRVWHGVGHPRPRPPSAAPHALAGGVHNIPLAPSTVTIPLEKLKLLQDSLQRAEHAISSSLAFTVEQSAKLANERLIVQNAIEIISGISGHSAFFGHHQ